MSRSLQIVQRIIPMLLSIILIRWIIVEGPYLRYWIDDFLKDTFHIILDNWELDHAVFGFSFGSPLLLFTLFLLSLKQFHLLRLLIVVVIFHILQMSCLIVLASISVDYFTLDFIETSFVTIPDIWFWNTTLLISSIISFLIITTTLYLIKHSQKRVDTKTID